VDYLLQQAGIPMAQNTTVVWAQFASHAAAEAIKDRLTDNGFARNSIEIYRNTDDSCDLAVHTRERNLAGSVANRSVTQFGLCLGQALEVHDVQRPSF
jgi:hypothetical protein